MTAPEERSVVIVGGGAAGTLAAIHLFRTGAPVDVTVVERSARLGAGVAYGTTEACQLLNVRCGAMSAYPEHPDHFAAWAGRRGDASGADDFLPRQLYAAYLREQLAEAVNPKSRLRIECSAATGVEQLPARAVVLDDGRRLAADRIILATGNHLPAGPAGLAAAGDRYIRDPWCPEWLDQVDSAASVLLIGTGLTAVDVVLSLLQRGHRGSIIAVSRRGLLPTGHTLRPAHPLAPCIQPGDAGAATARGLLRSVRRSVVEAEKRGEDWRQVIDGLRPVTIGLWQGLPPAERRRFLRHVARRWDIARHRVAPSVSDRVRAAVRRGQLEVHAGRVTDVTRVDTGVRVALTRAGTTIVVDTALVVDCTGPTADPVTGGNLLLCDVLGRGLARRDPHALGLQTAENGALIDRAGRPSDWLFTIGALRRGSEWETTAVPELRTQAVALAGHLTEASPRVAA
jgi:uncharacterized NAD(P)/FAD-binding protein YdhS